MAKDNLIDDVIVWADQGDPKDIDRWLIFCKRYLKKWKWNDKAIEDFLLWGEQGFNNKLLNRTQYSADEFYNEVEYCSDRMGLDRLFRCHVHYRNLI